MHQPRAVLGAGAGEVGDRVAVDRGGRRLVPFGPVDVGPRGGVEHHVVTGDGGPDRSGVGDVQLGAGDGGHLEVVPGGQHGEQVPAEHAARTGDEDPGHAAGAVFSGSHQARLSRYQATVWARPRSRSMLGAYPSSVLILLMSSE